MEFQKGDVMNRYLLHIFFLFFVFSFSNIMAQNWEWAVGGKGYNTFDYSTSIQCDASGNVYIAGYYRSDSLSFGPKVIRNQGLEDIFVAKFDPQGNCLWNVDFGGKESDRATFLTFFGNFLIVAGNFESKPATFGDFVANATLGSDIFIAILNATNGKVLNLITFAGDGYDDINYIFLDDSANIYISGEFSGEYIVLGSDTLKNFNYGTIYKGMTDGFVAKLSPLGKLIWAFPIGGVGNDRVNCAVVDKEGMVYIYGTYNSNNLTFLEKITNKGYSDIFLVKYDQYNKKCVWQMEISGTDKEYPASIAIGPDGNIYITGEFQSELLKLPSVTFTNKGTYDFFIVKIDEDGKILKARSFGSYSDEYAKKIVFDKNGNFYIGGYFASSTLTLDNFTLTNSASDAYSDVYVAKFDPELNPLWVQTAGGNGEDQSFAIAVDISGNVYQTGNFESREIFFGKKSIYNYGYSNIFLAKLNPNLPASASEAETEGLTIYPNPCKEFIYILADASAIGKCKITNVFGETIEEFELSTTRYLNTVNLPAGIYFLIFKNKIVPFHKL